MIPAIIIELAELERINGWKLAESALLSRVWRNPTVTGNQSLVGLAVLSRPMTKPGAINFPIAG